MSALLAVNAVLKDCFLPIFADLPRHACGERLQVHFLKRDGRYLHWEHDADGFVCTVTAKCPRCVHPETAVDSWHYHNAFYYGKACIAGAFFNRVKARHTAALLVALKLEFIGLKNDMAALILSHYSPLDSFLSHWSWDEETGTPLAYMLKHEDLVESTYVG